MNLNDLYNIPGSHKSKKRVGRGIGSGKGKTSGSGHKGQKARSGVAIKGFEGGQMPIYMRLPKRGFNSLNRNEFAKINLITLARLVEMKKIKEGDKITSTLLSDLGVVKKGAKVKLLGVGELNSKFEFALEAYSASAKKALEKAGCKIA